MKKSGFLLSTFYFLFSNIACVPHDISVPDEADAALPPSFESVLKKKLYSLDSYYLSDSSIPVESIMNNINFKSFDYSSLYALFCPAQSRTTGENGELNCSFASSNKFRQFSIEQNGADTAIKFEKFGTPKKYLSGKWKISKKGAGLSVQRYEIIYYDDYREAYLMVNSAYKLDNGKPAIDADGQIGSTLSGAFSFGTNGIQFYSCPDIPDGKIRIMADDDRAEVFWRTYGSCANTYAYVTLNDIYGKYKYNVFWKLLDLSDYLKEF